MTSNVPTIESLRRLAAPNSIVPPDAFAPHLVEWRGRWHGTTPLILAPDTVDELSRLMTFAYNHDIAMVPQGGNTGLVGGQIPNGEVLISTKRLRRIRNISPENFSITVESGVTLSETQTAAAEVGRLFPLSIGSEGTCQIGGVLSTNAGGVNVIRYGNARDLTLGLEAVLPNGNIWRGLNSLRKNNTGYELKHLLIGGEGTLGVITAATLKLYSQPAETLTAFVAVPSVNAAVSLHSLAKNLSGDQATSFEIMNSATLEIVLTAFPTLRQPVDTQSPYYCLIELSSGQNDVLPDMGEKLLEQAINLNLVTDGTVAANETQAKALWTLRHNASAAMKMDPSYCIKCDVSVPISNISKFFIDATNAVDAITPNARVIAFGHLGDGNIHFDILSPVGADDLDWRAQSSTLERAVHDTVATLNGSIAAEHGIGILKRDELCERKSDIEMNMMRAIKAVFDPKGLMNPGKLL